MDWIHFDVFKGQKSGVTVLRKKPCGLYKLFYYCLIYLNNFKYCLLKIYITVSTYCIILT